MQNPLLLRDALRYIAQYRKAIFVLKFGGDVVARGDFARLAQDIALMHSLGIRIVLVHGAAPQIEKLAALSNHSTEKVEGLRITDEPMLEIVKQAATGVSLDIISTLSAFRHLAGLKLRPTMSNAVRARAIGERNGTDYHRTGEIQRIDVPLIEDMLDQGMIPVLGPLGIDGKGDLFNINADEVALEVAAALRAEKLIFLTNVDYIQDADGSRISAISEKEMRAKLAEGKAFKGGMIPKVKACVNATERGVKRVHVLNGLLDGVLLLEIFSSRGVGTMVYSDLYENIRQAKDSDIFQLMRLIRDGVAQGKLKERTQPEVQEHIADFYVYEIDKRIGGCVALPHFPELKITEIACLHVDDRYKADGAGASLLDYAERVADEREDEFLFALSTQTGDWFGKMGYEEIGPEFLPPARRGQQKERGSSVFRKRLG